MNICASIYGFIVSSAGATRRRAGLKTKEALLARAISTGAICTIALGTFGTAQATEMVTFSFTNTYGNVGGTVTGTFRLPDACYTGCTDAEGSDFTITSFPSGLNSAHGAAPVDLSSFLTFRDNRITTDISGVITAIHVDAWVDASKDDGLFLNAGRSGANGLEIDGAGYLDPSHEVINYDGFGGATYTSDTATGAAPEPGTWAMLALGLGGLTRIRRRR